MVVYVPHTLVHEISEPNRGQQDGYCRSPTQPAREMNGKEERARHRFPPKPVWLSKQTWNNQVGHELLRHQRRTSHSPTLETSEELESQESGCITLPTKWNASNRVMFADTKGKEKVLAATSAVLITDMLSA